MDNKVTHANSWQLYAISGLIVAIAMGIIKLMGFALHTAVTVMLEV